MKEQRDNLTPEECFINSNWLKKHSPGDPIPPGDGLRIFDPFPSSPVTTQGIPRNTPALTFESLKNAIAILKRNIIIRFEVNQELFNEICTHIKDATNPKFRLINPHSILYNRYNSIPIVLMPDQTEQLTIIRRKETA